MSRKRAAQRIRTAKAVAKADRRARLWAQGCTDDGRPLDDPAYRVWLGLAGEAE